MGHDYFILLINERLTSFINLAATPLNTKHNCRKLPAVRLWHLHFELGLCLLVHALQLVEI
jgi:hypothetical protein